MLPAFDQDEIPPHPGHKQAASSNAPEDGRNYRPKHVELIEIINKIIMVTSSWLFILYRKRPDNTSK